ncbi:hypothetical protein PG997_013680 [Apiospora hydei]|uniref:Uncharacterized protein n=1 Tax=Apiospora hydei TaxID=1337664 RepID=A0ABR1VAE7_9PEZI
MSVLAAKSVAALVVVLVAVLVDKSVVLALAAVVSAATLSAVLASAVVTAATSPAPLAASKPAPAQTCKPSCPPLPTSSLRSRRHPRPSRAPTSSTSWTSSACRSTYRGLITGPLGKKETIEGLGGCDLMIGVLTGLKAQTDAFFKAFGGISSDVHIGIGSNLADVNVDAFAKLLGRIRARFNSGLVGLLNAHNGLLLRTGNWAFTTLQPIIATLFLNLIKNHSCCMPPATEATPPHAVIHDARCGNLVINQHAQLCAAALPPRTHLVITEIPGFMEGAHLNRGPGTEFLRHVERSGVIALSIQSFWREVGGRIDWDGDAGVGSLSRTTMMSEHCT